MKVRADIIAWIASIDSQSSSPSTQAAQISNKRPRGRGRDCDHEHRNPLSPPESSCDGPRGARTSDSMSEDERPSSKRRRLPAAREEAGLGNGSDLEDDVLVDPNATPRAKEKSRRRQSLSPTKKQEIRSGPSSILSFESVSDSQSRTSGRSSPTKRLAALELRADGLETRSLSLTDPLLPDALADLLAELEGCGTGAGIVSQARKADIEAQSKTDRSFALFRDFMYADANTRDKLGATPSVGDVLWILEEAKECQDAMQSEAGWNASVHFPLLHKAIYGGLRRKQLVGVVPCTVAKIIPEYLPANAPAKMIDFGIFLGPDDAPPSADNAMAAGAIHSLRRSLQCGVINHTDFLPLRRRPIVISIETKKRGGDQEEAELQIGTWHAAQWKWLSRLSADAGGSLEALPFLPALVVNGHEWSFAATTRDQQRTILWLDRSFGSTTSALGVYKIVWGLQRLARWAEDTYWPWFKANILHGREEEL